MISLYIDTHDANLVLALFKENKLLDKKELASNLHSKNTIPMLQELLTENKIEVEDIKEIIVIIGPGSFTGVRIGVVIAKILGYTKNIMVKPISILEAQSISYKGKVTLGLKDRNGAFIATFDNQSLIDDYQYLSNQELEKINKEIIYDAKVNLEELILYMQKKSPVNIHALKPLYVKKIEALK